jgi:hypothetical protein
MRNTSYPWFSQKISARFVLFHFGSVLPSVKLDYQAMFETAEIGDKRANSERDSQTRPLGSAALRLVSHIDAGTSRRTTAARAIAPKASAPLPFPRAVAVVRVREVWMAYPRKSTLTGSTHFVLLATSLQDTPRAGLRTQRAPVARG